MNKKPCLICGEGLLEARIGANRVEHSGVVRDLELHFSVCDACGCEQGDADQMHRNKLAMLSFEQEVASIHASLGQEDGK